MGHGFTCDSNIVEDSENSVKRWNCGLSSSHLEENENFRGEMKGQLGRVTFDLAPH